eukprot:Gb_02564 [translate_table: standard]
MAWVEQWLEMERMMKEEKEAQSDCVAVLRKIDDLDTMERALDVAEKLVRTIPYELDNIIVDLIRALVHVQWSAITVEGKEEYPEGKMHCALVALLVSCPLKSMEIYPLCNISHVDCSSSIISSCRFEWQRLSDFVRGLEWIHNWALHVANIESDSTMATECIQLHSEMALQAFRIMQGPKLGCFHYRGIIKWRAIHDGGQKKEGRLPDDTFHLPDGKNIVRGTG